MHRRRRPCAHCTSRLRGAMSCLHKRAGAAGGCASCLACNARSNCRWLCAGPPCPSSSHARRAKPSETSMASRSLLLETCGFTWWVTPHCLWLPAWLVSKNGWMAYCLSVAPCTPRACVFVRVCLAVESLAVSEPVVCIPAHASNHLACLAPFVPGWPARAPFSGARAPQDV